eukprot:gene5335-biopygen19227
MAPFPRPPDEWSLRLRGGGPGAPQRHLHPKSAGCGDFFSVISVTPRGAPRRWRGPPQRSFGLFLRCVIPRDHEVTVWGAAHSGAADLKDKRPRARRTSGKGAAHQLKLPVHATHITIPC